MELTEIREKTLPVFRKYGIERVAVFGSYAKGREREESDVDFLVRYAPGVKRSLFTHVRLVNELQDVLKKKVDVVSEQSLSQLLRDEVLRSARIIL